MATPLVEIAQTNLIPKQDLKKHINMKRRVHRDKKLNYNSPVNMDLIK